MSLITEYEEDVIGSILTVSYNTGSLRYILQYYDSELISVGVYDIITARRVLRILFAQSDIIQMKCICTGISFMDEEWS